MLRVKVAVGSVPRALPMLWLTGALHTLPGPEGGGYPFEYPRLRTQTVSGEPYFANSMFVIYAVFLSALSAPLLFVLA